MPGRRVIASTIGVVFALSAPFLNWEPIRQLPAAGILAQCLIASVLAAIAFAINKRTLKFFCFRHISWRDLGAALVAFAAVFIVVALAQPVIDHFAGSAAPDSAPDPLREDSLWYALFVALTAGVFEEFIYRGFIIEELGELIRNRRASAVVAVVFFALSHHVNMGWSLELVYPALIGSVMTILYLQRRNLPVCMLLHATLDSLHALTR